VTWKWAALLYFLRNIYLASSIDASNIRSPQAVRIADAWQCIRLITSSILGRYGSLRNDFLVTRDMNSHRLTTLLTHRIQEKTCQASWDIFVLLSYGAMFRKIFPWNRDFYICFAKDETRLISCSHSSAILTAALNTLSLDLGECYSITKVINVLSR